MEVVQENIRLALRSLRHSPAFAVTAIVTLAIGIGLATAVFTVADAVLLRRLPVVDQDRIVVLFGATPDHSLDNVPLALDDARAFARASRALSHAAFFLYNGAVSVTVRDGDRISQLQRALVSGDYFDVLGAKPMLGRGFRAADDAPGAAPVMVLSHRAWQEHFGGTPDVVGRQITLHDSGIAWTVVGVMPPGLDFPRGTDAWAPVRAAIPPQTMHFLDFDVIGRLAPNARAADAQNEMTAYFRRDAASPWEHKVRGVVGTLPALVLGDTRPAIVAFGLAAALLLLITCINVANLLLVRGLARIRDVAIRAALGASRARIAGQLLTEYALLAIAGGALGVAVAAAAVHAFVASAPAGLPRLEEVQLSGGALAAACVITAAATCLFAVAPLRLTSHIEAADALRSGARQSASRRSRLLSEGLVAGQVALALLVLSAAGLVGRSLMKLHHVDLAFDSSRLLIAELSFRADRYDTAPKQVALLDQLVTALQTIPGVTAVSPVVAAPYGTRSWEGRPKVEGQSEQDAARNPMIDFEVVAPSFFTTLGLPVVRGRGFTDDDRNGSPAVVMLSQSIARFYWPGADPIGKHVMLDTNQMATVVGIVPDTRYRVLRESHASIYFPLRQSFFPFAPNTLVIHSARRPADLAAAMRGVMATAAPGVALASIASFDALVAAPLSQPRTNALLLAVFAAASLTLAGVGLFGVLATMVRQRTRELGVRMALGASPSDVARLVLRRGLLLAATGAAVGLVGALAANRLLITLLFEVNPTDAATLGGVALGVLVMATLACIIPAQSSARIEPAVALRTD